MAAEYEETKDGIKKVVKNRDGRKGARGGQTNKGIKKGMSLSEIERYKSELRDELKDQVHTYLKQDENGQIKCNDFAFTAFDMLLHNDLEVYRKKFENCLNPTPKSWLEKGKA